MDTPLSAISFLLLCIIQVSALDKFPEKFVLGQVGDNVTLRCHTAELTVTWKFESGEEVEPSEETVIDGKKLILHDLQEDQLGNYTCWSNGKVVDYTHILLDESSKFTDSSIMCTAETFNCTYKISCRMDQAGFNVFRLRNKRDESTWVQRSADGAFHLTHTTNPYAEEAERLVVTGEGASTERYFKINHSFYLRDIIKPATPGIDVDNSKVILKPPATWAEPLSYYPLEHEIQCMRRDDGTETFCELGSNMKVPKGISKLRVRCRDSLLLSQWSDWTPWQNVRKKTKQNQRTKDGTKKGSRSKKKNKQL